jgi:hypothetical protein
MKGDAAGREEGEGKVLEQRRAGRHCWIVEAFRMRRRVEGANMVSRKGEAPLGGGETDGCRKEAEVARGEADWTRMGFFLEYGIFFEDE